MASAAASIRAQPGGACRLIRHAARDACTPQARQTWATGPLQGVRRPRWRSLSTTGCAPKVQRRRRLWPRRWASARQTRPACRGRVQLGFDEDDEVSRNQVPRIHPPGRLHSWASCRMCCPWPGPAAARRDSVPRCRPLGRRATPCCSPPALWGAAATCCWRTMPTTRRRPSCCACCMPAVWPAWPACRRRLSGRQVGWQAARVLAWGCLQHTDTAPIALSLYCAAAAPLRQNPCPCLLSWPTHRTWPCRPGPPPAGLPQSRAGGGVPSARPALCGGPHQRRPVLPAQPHTPPAAPLPAAACRECWQRWQRHQAGGCSSKG